MHSVRKVEGWEVVTGVHCGEGEREGRTESGGREVSGQSRVKRTMCPNHSIDLRIMFIPIDRRHVI